MTATHRRTRPGVSTRAPVAPLRPSSMTPDQGEAWRALGIARGDMLATLRQGLPVTDAQREAEHAALRWLAGLGVRWTRGHDG